MKTWFIATAIVLLLSLDGCSHADPVIQSDPDLSTSDGVYG